MNSTTVGLMEEAESLGKKVAYLFEQADGKGDEESGIIKKHLLETLFQERPQDVHLISFEADKKKKRDRTYEAGGKNRIGKGGNEGPQSKEVPAVPSFPCPNAGNMVFPLICSSYFPSSETIIAIDIEGLKLKGAKNAAATVAVVHQRDVVFWAFVFHEANTVEKYYTEATKITAKKIAKGVLSVSAIKDYLLHTLLVNKPTIVGWDLENEWRYLDMTEEIKGLYGWDGRKKIIDLQMIMQRWNQETTWETTWEATRNGNRNSERMCSLAKMMEAFKGDMNFDLKRGDGTHSAIHDARGTLKLYLNVFLRRHNIVNFWERVTQCETRSKEEKQRDRSMFTMPDWKSKWNNQVFLFFESLLLCLSRSHSNN